MAPQRPRHDLQLLEGVNKVTYIVRDACGFEATTISFVFRVPTPAYKTHFT